MKTLVALLLVMIAGTVAVGHVTDGFQVVTSESARRLSLEKQARPVPTALLQYESGTAQPFAQSLRDDGRIAIAVFFYARCNAICSVMGAELQQLQQILLERGLDQRIRLLSISFDAKDEQADLAAYAKRMRARTDNWRFARISDGKQREALLDTFDVIVIPAPLGEYEHNAAFHIVTPEGELVRIIDYDQPEVALDYALSYANRSRDKTAAWQGGAS